MGKRKAVEVAVGVQDVRDVEDLLKEVKRLKGVKEEAEKRLGGRVGEKGFGW